MSAVQLFAFHINPAITMHIQGVGLVFGQEQTTILCSQCQQVQQQNPTVSGSLSSNNGPFSGVSEAQIASDPRIALKKCIEQNDLESLQAMLDQTEIDDRDQDRELRSMSQINAKLDNLIRGSRQLSAQVRDINQNFISTERQIDRLQAGTQSVRKKIELIKKLPTTTKVRRNNVGQSSFPDMANVNIYQPKRIKKHLHNNPNTTMIV